MKLNNINLFESEGIDTRIITNKMNKWGRKNIERFDTVVKEERLTVDIEKESFSDWSMAIITQDKVLPYTIHVQGSLYLEAPNLISFNKLPHTHLDDYYLSLMRFKSCRKLDFNNLNFHCFREIVFIDLNTLTPQNMMSSTARNLMGLSIDSCHGQDIENYLHFTVETLYFINQPTHLKNMSLFLEKTSGIRKISIHPKSSNNMNNMCVYSNEQCDLLTDITSKYATLVSRSEYVMDFVVDLINGGFQNEV